MRRLEALSQDKGGKVVDRTGAHRRLPAWRFRRLTSRTAASSPTSTRKPIRCRLSPKLEFGNVPMGTVSFTLIMHDPDNATLNKKADDVLHWMAFNIPGTARGLNGGQSADAKLPDGTIQAKSLRGTPGYMGPGNQAINPYHHYTMELFALDTVLPLGPDATRDDVYKAMDGHIIGKAILVDAESARINVNGENP